MFAFERNDVDFKELSILVWTSESRAFLNMTMQTMFCLLGRREASFQNKSVCWSDRSKRTQAGSRNSRSNEGQARTLKNTQIREAG
jgi:hypothetical protein